MSERRAARRRRLMTGVAALVVTATACDGGAGTDGDDRARPTTTAPPAAVSVGDCLPALQRTEPFPSTTDAPTPTLPPVSQAATVPCSEPHAAEVFHVAQVNPGPDGEYPGDRDIVDQSVLACTGATFEAYVGAPEEESGLRVTPLAPSMQSWDAGDRTIVCLVRHPLGDPLTGSVRGQGGPPS